MVSDFHLKPFKDEMGQIKSENLFTFDRKLNLLKLRNALLIPNNKISKEINSQELILALFEEANIKTLFK